VNAIGVGVMLATFIHTAGLTATEVGIAAGTAFLNQRLLSALFGEAAMVELIGRARQRLEEALAASFAEERSRFEALVAKPIDLDTLVADLREAAAEVRRLAEASSDAPEASDAALASPPSLAPS
jgi:septal ring factor EnvC (AmiA/AmiB activator)